MFVGTAVTGFTFRWRHDSIFNLELFRLLDINFGTAVTVAREIQFLGATIPILQNA